MTSFPGRGHLNPVLPLALAARDAGHDVRVASGADQLAHIARYGLEAVEIGPGLDGLIAAARREHGDAWGDRLFPDAWPRMAVPRLSSFARTWSPDLVVSEEEEYAGILVADLLGVPSVTHSWPSPCRPLVDRRQALAALAPVWRDLAAGHEPRNIGQTYLDACPPPLQSPEIRDIDGVIPIRPVSLQESVDNEPPPWLGPSLAPRSTSRWARCRSSAPQDASGSASTASPLWSRPSSSRPGRTRWTRSDGCRSRSVRSPT